MKKNVLDNSYLKTVFVSRAVDKRTDKTGEKITNKKISLPVIFFEEDPHNPEVQKKASLLDFPTILFLAANSLEEFYSLREKYLKINPNIEIAWWPIFKSVWLSPFTKPKEIENVIDDLSSRREKEKRLKVLLDLELPFLRPQYFIVGLFYFTKSKKLIFELIKRADNINVEIFSFEYYPHAFIFPKLLEILGLTFLKLDCDYQRIVSAYTSFLPPGFRQLMKKSVLYAWRKRKRRMFMAVGVFAPGRTGIERKISVKGIEKDIEYFLKRGIDKFAFFRLGGLNRDYLEIIKKYLPENYA